MIEAVLKRKGVVSLLIANGGVAISLLYGGFTFLTSIEDTAEAVDDAHYRIEELNVRLDQDIQDALGSSGEDGKRAIEELGFLRERLGVLETEVRSTPVNDFESQVDESRREVQNIRERLAGLEPEIQNLIQESYKLDELERRLDELDDFVVRWDEQAQSIMTEHEQFSGIIKEIWEAIDQRGQVPSGTSRNYGDY